MTNLEYMKTLTAEQLHDFIFKKTNYMCLQHGKYDKEIWQQHCLGKYNSPRELKCRQCRIDWLNSELGVIEKELEEAAIQRRSSHGI